MYKTPVFDSFRQIGKKDLERIVKADMELEEEVNKYIEMFSDASKETATLSLDDMSAIRETLLSIYELKILLEMKHITLDSLNQFGSMGFELSVKRFSKDDRLEGGLSVSDMQDNLKKFLAKDPSLDADKGANERLAVGSVSPKDFLCLGTDLFSGAFIYRTRSKGMGGAASYRKFLKEGIEHAKRAGYACSIRTKGNQFILDTCTDRFPDFHPRYFNEDDKGIRQFLNVVIDTLFAIHFFDIDTLTENGVPYQKPKSLASSLWFRLAEELMGGRVGRCALCGAPFVARKERGTPRMYCAGGACNKRHQRLNRYKKYLTAGDDEETAAKKAGIKLKTAEQYLLSADTDGRVIGG